MKGIIKCTACTPISQDIPDLESGMYINEVPATKVYTIAHKGPYKYAGNVWSAQYSRSRAKVFKQNKKTSPVEVYHNSPMNTPKTNSFLKSYSQFTDQLGSFLPTFLLL